MAFLDFIWLFYCFELTASTYTPLPPSIDALYQPPPDLQDRQNGEILRSRLLPNSPPDLSISIAATYQLLFRTTDSNGLVQAAMTTILVPVNTTNSHLFSMQTAYDSPAIDCAPSYQLYNSLSSIQEREIINLALSEGWIVSIPDLEGYQGAFTNGIYSGQVVLDSLRAALHSGTTTGIASSAKILLAGGSGGALGSEWALELHDSYAPEMKIEGAMLLALTPNVTSVFQSVEGTVNAPLIPLAVLGLAKSSLELSNWLAENLLSMNETEMFLQASKVCFSDFSLLFGAQNVSQTYFGRENALLDDVPQAVIRDLGIMGQHGIPRVPIFTYKGTADEVSPAGDTDLLVQKYCDAGSRIRYLKGIGVSHAESSKVGFIAGWEWVRERMRGIEVEEGCHSTEVAV